MNKKILVSTIAALLSFSGATSASYVLKFNNSQSKGMIPEESAQSTNASCKDILDNGQSTGDGVYSITVNNKEFDVYCDMTSAGGGWTMVVAQFEQDPVTNWNEGIQADYDPSLATNKGFALNSQEIPNHTQTAFGKDLDADNIDYTDFNYTTGQINKIIVNGASGVDYHVSRHNTDYYSYHNPDGENFSTASPNPIWAQTLTFDKFNERAFTWAFAPRNTTQSNRGYAYDGNYYHGVSNDFAWTVWVR